MDPQTPNNISVTSYNSWGFNEARQEFIKTLQVFSDIICIQEHLLLDAKDKKHSNTNKIIKLFGDQFDIHITPRTCSENNRVYRERASA